MARAGHGAFGRGRIFAGGTENGHNHVTHEFIHHTAVLVDDPRHRGHMFVEQGNHLLRRHMLGELGVFPDVTKEHRHPAHLTAKSNIALEQPIGHFLIRHLFQ